MTEHQVLRVEEQAGSWPTQYLRWECHNYFAHPIFLLNTLYMYYCVSSLATVIHPSTNRGRLGWVTGRED